MEAVTISYKLFVSFARLRPSGLDLIEPAKLVEHIVLVAEKGMLPLLLGISIRKQLKLDEIRKFATI